jgi:hypothetical protein
MWQQVHAVKLAWILSSNFDFIVSEAPETDI